MQRLSTCLLWSPPFPSPNKYSAHLVLSFIGILEDINTGGGRIRAPLSKNTSGGVEFWTGLFITWQAKRNVIITLSGLRGMDRESLAQGSSQTATDFT